MIKSFPNSLIEYSTKNKNLFFVQVGANDGVRADPIYDLVKKYKWKGMMIEPIKEFFDQLKDNYQNLDNLIFENIAISTKRKIVLFRVKRGAPWLVSYFGKTLSSSSKRILEKNMWFLPGAKKYIVKNEIPSLTLKKVLDKHDMKTFDFLLIDTEGYDFEVLKQLKKFRNVPKFVYYEHKHLSNKDKVSAWKFLEDRGYNLEKDVWNTFGYLT